MKHISSLERELLEILEESDEGEGVAFSDHTYVKGRNYSKKDKDDLLQNRDLTNDVRYHLKLLAGCQFVNVVNGCDEWESYSLTLQGHERLERIRKNTLVRKIFRVLGNWLDKAMTSIFFPIIVTVLTVLIMDYFGLGNGAIEPEK